MGNGSGHGATSGLDYSNVLPWTQTVPNIDTESLKYVRDKGEFYACWSLSRGVKPAAPVLCILEF
jgi:hypothetical protein